MALDGIFLSQLKHEIITKAQDARVDRIAQPYRDEIILHLRWRGGTGKLLLSASANNPRIHFIENVPENPLQPPMFCMLLRKHLAGAKLKNIRQQGLDRILYLEFEAMNELGDLVMLTLAHEIMGKHSNIVLIDQNNIVLDSVHRIGFEASIVRQVLPNLKYQLPPQQEKLDISQATVEEALVAIKECHSSLSKGIVNTLQGISPLPSRELAFLACGIDLEIDEITPQQWNEVNTELSLLKQMIDSNNTTPIMIVEEDGHPKDFTFMEIKHYGSTVLLEKEDSFSLLVEKFYHRRNTMEQMRQKSSDLHRLVKNTKDRIVRRLAAQKEERLNSLDRDELRIKGDILTTNIYQLKQGMSSITLENFYEEDNLLVEISLDPLKTPAQNAQLYFSKYRKADTAEKILTKQIEQGELELEYIYSVIDSLERAKAATDLANIREELVNSGYAKRNSRNKKQKPIKQKPLQYLSSDGFIIFAGRNNTQNDALTLKNSQKNDIWFHTQKIPGSHTVIVTEGQKVPDPTLQEAASIAAYHSQAQNSTNVPVDYTEIRYVKKPNGAKPGMVIYDKFNTIFVTPDEQYIVSLEQK